MISAIGRVRAPGGGRLRGSASAPVVADYHPSKPVGALYSLRIYYPLTAPSLSEGFAAVLVERDRGPVL